MGGASDRGVSIAERVIGERGIGERLIGERENFGSSDRGVIEINNNKK